MKPARDGGALMYRFLPCAFAGFEMSDPAAIRGVSDQTAGRRLLRRLSLLLLCTAEGNEVHLSIISRLTPQLDVVYLQVGSVSALLAIPPVPPQHLATQLFI